MSFNPTKFLARMNGTRVTAVSGGATVQNVLRASLRKPGQLSDAGLDAEPRCHLYFAVLAFGDARDISDLITVDGTPAIILSLDIIGANTIARADALLLEDTAQIGGVDVPCHINNVRRSTGVFPDGFLPEDAESLTTHKDLLPDGASVPAPTDPITLTDGRERYVNTVSTDNTGKVLSVTLQAKGAE